MSPAPAFPELSWIFYGAPWKPQEPPELYIALPPAHQFCFNYRLGLYLDPAGFQGFTRIFRVLSCKLLSSIERTFQSRLLSWERYRRPGMQTFLSKTEYRWAFECGPGEAASSLRNWGSSWRPSPWADLEGRCSDGYPRTIEAGTIEGLSFPTKISLKMLFTTWLVI